MFMKSLWWFSEAVHGDLQRGRSCKQIITPAGQREISVYDYMTFPSIVLLQHLLFSYNISHALNFAI